MFIVLLFRLLSLQVVYRMLLNSTENNYRQREREKVIVMFSVLMYRKFSAQLV